MAIDPQVNTILADRMYKIYAEAEQKMMLKVKNRVERGITEPGWAERKLKETRAMTGELHKLVKDTERLASREVSDGIAKAFREGGNMALKDIGIPDTLLRDVKIPPKIQRLILESENMVNRTSLIILRESQDVFRSIQAEMATQILTGVETRREVAQTMLNRMADKGITGFIDKAGRNWAMASYVEMATRTVANRASTMGHIDRQLENGRDLVITSSHGGACPICIIWENEVLSISGTNPKYRSFSEAESGGLFHPNCRHSITGYIEGLTKLHTLTQQDRERSAEMYDYSQRQRGNERQIRRWKNRELVAITPQDKMKAQNKIKEFQGVQRELLKDYEQKFGVTMRRKYDRESIGNRTGRIGVSTPIKIASPTQMRERVQAKQAKQAILPLGQAASQQFPFGKYKIVQQNELEGETNAFWNKLSYQEIDASKKYIATGNSFELNRLLYSGKYAQFTNKSANPTAFDSKKVEEINAFSALIEKAKIPFDMKVVRNVGIGSLEDIVSKTGGGELKSEVNQLLQGGEKKFEDIALLLNKKVAGTKYVNESFISTSFNEKVNVFKGRPVQLELYAKKGTTGLVTQNWDESEIIFNKGTELRIIGFGTKVSDRKDQILTIQVEILK